MLGYFKDEAATRQAAPDGWFRTGDLGVMHPDGYVELRDRSKDVIISGGENIATVEVEQAIADHPAVLEVAVVAAPSERWGEVPVAYVTLHEGAAGDRGGDHRARAGRGWPGSRRPSPWCSASCPRPRPGRSRSRSCATSSRRPFSRTGHDRRTHRGRAHGLRPATRPRLGRLAVRGRRSSRSRTRASSPGQVDALITGYSTVASHLMPADLFAERFGIRPATAFGMSSGGATGLAMLVAGGALGRAGSRPARAGRGRGEPRERPVPRDLHAGLAQVGHAAYEVPLGGTVPAYYALLASRYL